MLYCEPDIKAKAVLIIFSKIFMEILKYCVIPCQSFHQRHEMMAEIFFHCHETWAKVNSTPEMRYC
jgi:hypothetical protein